MDYQIRSLRISFDPTEHQQKSFAEYISKLQRGGQMNAALVEHTSSASSNARASNAMHASFIPRLTKDLPKYGCEG